MSGMKVKELMDSLKGDCYRFRVHYPEEWEFGLITGATFFGANAGWSCSMGRMT